jgi:hypothetical protein
MIKTHNITGLKYLCQTKQNPFTYNGSGTDWKPHLKQYGTTHSTEILFESQSKEEVGKWGRYYSTYYNIVNAQDDFGNKIWANRIPETGGGGDFSEEHRINIGKSGKGRIPWNKGKKGVQSSTRKGKTYKEIYGEMRAMEYKTQISNTLTGNEPWNKGNITGLHWWTDGTYNKLCKESPGFKWRPGKLQKI